MLLYKCNFSAIIIVIYVSGWVEIPEKWNKKGVKNMVVMPVSGALSSHRTNSYMSFGGRRDNADSGEENLYANDSRSSANLAKVPVVVLMAMSPAMLNANQPETKAALNGLSPKVEMVQAVPAETKMNDAATIAPFEELPEVQQSSGYDPLKQYDYDNKKILLHDTFRQNGKKYHLVFVHPEYLKKDAIHAVHIFPDGFKSDERHPMPKVTEFIVHNVPGQELWGSVIVRSTEVSPNYEFTDTFTDMRLPDEQAQKVLDLIQDASSFIDVTNIKYNKVTTPKLRPTRVTKN